ncbi:MAG: alpha/beta hydrolase [Proteobacteria bacterium]|nr:alpha/beta hydrolase [Pseudomonadota bacterium]
MANVTANGIKIEYDTFGDKSGPALLLIMGLGGQMIHWEEDFCKQLADEDLYVIRFDNRDIGLSQHFDELGIPDVMGAVAASMEGKEIESSYSVDDMADDAVGLLDALNIDKAHICGASMGGMITQTVGIRHPARVMSLVSIMSSTGNPELPQSKPEAMEVLLTPSPEERNAYIERSVENNKVIGSPGFSFDEKRVREIAGQAFDRSFHPQGIARQTVAIIAHGNRKPALASVRAPTLVIHGADDPLVPIEGGQDTVDAIPGAELLVIDGMGHNLPQETWTQIVGAISNHTRKTLS